MPLERRVQPSCTEASNTLRHPQVLWQRTSGFSSRWTMPLRLNGNISWKPVSFDKRELTSPRTEYSVTFHCDSGKRSLISKQVFLVLKKKKAYDALYKRKHEQNMRTGGCGSGTARQCHGVVQMSCRGTACLRIHSRDSATELAVGLRPEKGIYGV